eukprot:14255-Heterococcus_DN1.PRE.1
MNSRMMVALINTRTTSSRSDNDRKMSENRCTRDTSSDSTTSASSRSSGASSTASGSSRSRERVDSDMGGPLDKDAILLQVSRSYASKQNDRKILKNIGRCAAAARLLESISDCCD